MPEGLEGEKSLGERYAEKREEFHEAAKELGPDSTFEERLSVTRAKAHESQILSELVGLIEESSRPYIEAYSHWLAEREKLRNQMVEAKALVEQLGSDPTHLIEAVDQKIRSHEERGKNDPNVQRGREVVDAKRAYLARIEKEEKQKEAERIIAQANSVNHFGLPRGKEQFTYSQVIKEAIEAGFLQKASNSDFEKAKDKGRAYEYLRYKGEYYTFPRRRVWDQESRKKVEIYASKQTKEVFRSIKNMLDRCIKEQKQFEQLADELTKDGGRIVKTKQGRVLLQKAVGKKGTEGWLVIHSTTPEVTNGSFYLADLSNAPRVIRESQKDKGQQKEVKKNKDSNQKAAEQKNVDAPSSNEENETALKRAFRKAGFIEE